MMMTIRETRTAPAARAPAAALSGIRWQSYAMAVLLLVQFGLGIGVNLFVTLPRQDHAAGLGTALANGPVAVSMHIVLGLALIITALVIAVQAVMARHGGIIALAVLGLAGLTSAAINGTRFAGTGQNGDSMAMALAWAVAMLCYLSLVFITGRPARR
jgi:hypothetical protein